MPTYDSKRCEAEITLLHTSNDLIKFDTFFFCVKFLSLEI